MLIVAAEQAHTPLFQDGCRLDIAPHTESVAIQSPDGLWQR